ncbi:MAG: MFS transporter [Tissierellia bacterium]|nr:MFS transporter [Tissierellia bacterium]
MKKVSVWRFFVLEALYSCFSGLVHPITPTLFKNLNFPDYVYGVVFASMSLGMFLFSPFWGKLGDRIGHSKSFAIVLPAYAISQLFFGISTTPLMAVISRFFSGATGGGAQVAALAYIINATSIENRGRILAYYAALNSVCKALGFFIGGLLGTISIPAVFVLQGILLFAGGIFALVFVKDPDVDNSMYVSDSYLNPFGIFIEMKDIMSKALLIFLSSVILATLASTVYDTAYNYYINSELNLLSSYNGIIKAITGITGLIANFTVNVYIANKTDMRKSIITVFLLCGTFALTAPFMPTIRLFFVGGILFYLVNTIYLPIQQAIIMTDFNNASSGSMSGILNSVRSVGMILGSLLEGLLFTINSALPFIVSSTIFLISSLISFIYLNIYIKSKKYTCNTF